jgi:predicted dehydrogenase
MNDKKVNVGVIGVGSLGRHHARWYKRIDDVDLVGVYDVDKDRAKVVADEVGTKVFDSLEELTKQIDAASIAVSTQHHYNVAKNLIENGVHCLIEKPITSTLEQAKELATLAQKNNIKLTVGHIERFNPAVVALKTHDLNPMFIEAHRLAAFSPRGADVSVILDLMIHDIELCMYLVKSPIERIDASSVAVVSKTADIANARISFANGATANITAGRLSFKAMRKLRIFQSSAYFSLDLAEKQLEVYQLASEKNKNVEGMRISLPAPVGAPAQEIICSKTQSTDTDMLCMELQSFVRSIRDNSDPEICVDQAITALDIALQIEKIGSHKFT